jgi:hypothetical protein
MKLIGSFVVACIFTLVVSAIVYALWWLGTHFGIISAIIGGVIVVLTAVFYFLLED